MRSANTTLAVMALALLTAACAGGPRKPPPPGPAERAMRKTPSVVGLLFSRFDTDLDFRITRTELNAGVDKAFAAADSNGDKDISPLEFEVFAKSALGGTSAPPFRLDFDRNVDGHITYAEFHDELLATADELDKDKDGVLTQDELTKVTPGKNASGKPEDDEHDQKSSGPERGTERGTERRPGGAPPGRYFQG